MLQFPLHNAALDLQGKPPEELPHGLLPIPPEVRELVAEQYARFPAEARAPYEWRQVCRETVHWFFSGLGQEVLHRQTPEGPEVLAVGFDEIFALTDGRSPEKMAGLETYQDY